MSYQFKDQVAIVTGGASGIGLAIAKRLASEGAKIAIFDLNPSLQPVVNEMGAGFAAFPVDVTDETQVTSVTANVVETFGRIDILINSAGVTGKTNLRSHEVELGDFRLVFEVNLIGSFLTARAVLPHMLNRQYGRILHIASVSGKEGNAGMLAYSASKAAVIGMTKVQGKEYAEDGITVNALAPAVIRTPMVDALPEAQVKYMTDKIPIKRCGTLEEIAHLAAFIVSPGASFTTGFTFDMTGGRATY
ncbi:MAG: SDR family oxidoreductase [Acidobacteria bacterium]|nr:SDR family oxidoreductase [Acidobacteriota bacterium]MCI0659658.1 SDR family oxidoreductase [Acidobacteriota bacterium]